MRSTILIASRGALVGAVLLASVALPSVAHAAPHAGPPFFLARVEAENLTYQIAGNDHGYLLAWSAAGSVRAQRFGTDAALSARPETIAARSDGGTQSTEWRGARVVANEMDFLVQYSSVSMVTPPDGVAVLGGGGPSFRLFGESGGVVPTPSINLDSGGRTFNSAVMNEAGAGFAVLHNSFHPSPSGGIGMTVLVTGGSAAGASKTLLGQPAGLMNLVAVVSDGTRALFADRRTSSESAWFTKVSADGSSGSIFPKGGATMTGTVRMVRHGSTVFVVWDDGARVSAVRLSLDGDLIDTAPIALGGGADAAASGETLLDVEVAENSLLVLSAVSGDGGSILRARRLSTDGEVLDPDGIDVGSGSTGDLARAGAELWLLATHETVGGEELVRGRFVGEGTLPDAPPNVPPSLDAGSEAVSDASVPAAGSGGRAGGTGSGGRQAASGGARPGDSPDASTGGTGSNGAAPDDSGCAVRRNGTGSSVAARFLAAAFAALGLRRRALVRLRLRI